MTQSQAIAPYQPLLLSIALKITGKMADAEDLVQDTLLRWIKIDPSTIKNTKAYLISSIRHACYRHISLIEEKKYKLVDFLEQKKAEFADHVRMFDTPPDILHALHKIHHLLGPAERAIYLLREIFDIDYEDIAVQFDKTSENCRKIVSRARSRLNEVVTIPSTVEGAWHFVVKFKKACDFGELNAFIDKLKADIQLK